MIENTKDNRKKAASHLTWLEVRILANAIAGYCVDPDAVRMIVGPSHGIYIERPKGALADSRVPTWRFDSAFNSLIFLHGQ